MPRRENRLIFCLWGVLFEWIISTIPDSKYNLAAGKLAVIQPAKSQSPCVSRSLTSQNGRMGGISGWWLPMSFSIQIILYQRPNL